MCDDDVNALCVRVCGFVHHGFFVGLIPLSLCIDLPSIATNVDIELLQNWFCTLFTVKPSIGRNLIHIIVRFSECTNTNTPNTKYQFRLADL